MREKKNTVVISHDSHQGIPRTNNMSVDIIIFDKLILHDYILESQRNKKTGCVYNAHTDNHDIGQVI